MWVTLFWIGFVAEGKRATDSSLKSSVASTPNLRPGTRAGQMERVVLDMSSVSTLFPAFIIFPVAD